jgi:hypothetical protein
MCPVKNMVCVTKAYLPTYNTVSATITGQQKQYLSNDCVLHPECEGYGTIITSVRLHEEAKEQSITTDRCHGYDRGQREYVPCEVRIQAEEPSDHRAYKSNIAQPDDSTLPD